MGRAGNLVKAVSTAQLPTAPLRYSGPAPHPSGDRMVFLVPSDRNPRIKYRVDALGNNGRMWCQCPNFGIRKQPALDRGEPAFTEATLCKHCVKVIFYFVGDLFATMAASECSPTDC